MNCLILYYGIIYRLKQYSRLSVFEGLVERKRVFEYFDASSAEFGADDDNMLTLVLH